MFTLAELEAAVPIVRAAMPPTPQFAWPLLQARTGVDVVVKHENHTPTGAFKVRGGIVYADRLKRERPHVKGVITATRGNHGQSLAFACARAGIACTVVVPFGNSTEKNAAMKAFGAELIEHGRDFDEARERAVEIAARARLRIRQVVRPRSGARRRDLRLRAVHRRAGARRGLCADRAWLRHLRRDRGARCARMQGAGHRRRSRIAPTPTGSRSMPAARCRPIRR